MLIKPVKLLSTILFSATLLQANCTNSVSFEEFLKETTKFEETLSLYKSKNDLLTKEVKKLKEKLKEMQSKSQNTIQEDTYAAGNYKIAIPEANIYIESNQESYSPYSLVRDEIVQIEFCDKFDWCKLKEKKFFIKKLAIIPVRQ